MTETLSTAEVRDLLKTSGIDMSPQLLHHYRKRKLIPARLNGRKWEYPQGAMLDWIAGERMKRRAIESVCGTAEAN